MSQPLPVSTNCPPQCALGSKLKQLHVCDLCDKNTKISLLTLVDTENSAGYKLAQSSDLKNYIYIKMSIMSSMASATRRDRANETLCPVS